MLLPVLAFLFGVALVSGGYYAVFVLPSLRAQRQIEVRLHEFTQPVVSEAAATVVMSHTAGLIPLVDRVMATTAAGGKLRVLIEQSGVRTTPSEMISASAGAAVACGAIAFLTLRHPAAIVCGAIAGLVAPFGWLLQRRSSRMKKFEEQFPEALDLMSRAIRAGHAFQTAMGMVGDELPAPVGPEFKKTFDRQNFGLPVGDTMNEMADRVPLIDVRFFVTAIAIQRETGGNLAEILDNLAHVVRERFKILRQVRVHTAHGRFTGYVLLALPAALAVALSFISPEHMKLLFREPMGQMMLVGALVLQTIGFIWIRQVIKIEV
jgi:tight adherence protein B